VAVILVIDDDEQIRRMLKWALQKEGHDVLDTPDGREGASICRKHGVELILTDILMPHKDGLDVMMEIRSEFPGVKIVAMSGGSATMPSTGCLHLASELGANEVLAKPIAKKQLLDAVNKVLGNV